MNEKLNEITNEFKTKLYLSVNSRIDAINKNQDKISDICFKVLSIPNCLIILSVFYIPIQVIIHSIFYLKVFYWITIGSYLVYAISHILSLYSGIYWFKYGISKTMVAINNLQKIIDEPKELTVEFQNEMNKHILSTAYLNWLTMILKEVVSICNIINILSLSLCIIILINNLV